MPSTLPKYTQISEMLIREIASGRLRVGERLPPERKLAADLGIAVGTLRRSLQDLTDKGVITRRHGSGNYVQSVSQVPAIYNFFRLERPEGGGLPTARVLDLVLCGKDPELPKFGNSSEAWRIRRLRSLDDTLVAAEEIWLDFSYADRLEADELSESLYLHYQTELNLWISRVVDQVSAAVTPDWASELGLSDTAPCGFVLRQSYDQKDYVAEVSRTWFHPDRAKYVSRMN
ncbi:MAG: GntR family transcriptional regulator [Mangrovicoccus sp.]